MNKNLEYNNIPQPEVDRVSKLHNEVAPTPVIKVLSPHGLKYVMMTISLFMVATGLALTSIFFATGQGDFSGVIFPIAISVVGLPFFVSLFLHIKKQELGYPELKLDASKRACTQWSQIISFITILVTLVVALICLLSSIAGAENIHIGKIIACTFFTLTIFCGLLAYYWQDERIV